MTKITDPVKLEEARARMAKARATRMGGKYPQDVETRVAFVRELVIKQFKDAGLSVMKDGELIGGPSARYYHTKLVNGSLTIKDMILLGDYMPVDWTLIFRSVRQPRMFCVHLMLRQHLLIWSLLSLAITRLLVTLLMWMVCDGRN